MKRKPQQSTKGCWIVNKKRVERWKPKHHLIGHYHLGTQA